MSFRLFFATIIMITGFFSNAYACTCTPACSNGYVCTMLPDSHGRCTCEEAGE